MTNYNLVIDTNQGRRTIEGATVRPVDLPEDWDGRTFSFTVEGGVWKFMPREAVE